MMTKEHKRFILKKLIPFILRAEGRGFVMRSWIETRGFRGDQYLGDDGETYSYPRCGTAACIGGSISVLLGKKNYEVGGYGAGRAIGLSPAQARNLFYGWEDKWPQPYLDKFDNPKTPLARAKVAAALLREVCRTNGKCLVRSRSR